MRLSGKKKVTFYALLGLVAGYFLRPMIQSFLLRFQSGQPV